MPLQGIQHGWLVAVSLLGLHVQQYRAVLHLLLGLDEGLRSGVHVMPIDGPHVAEAQILEEQAGHHEPLETLLAPLGGLRHALAQAFQRDGLDGVFDAIPPTMVVLAGHDLVEIALERAHVGIDAHVVVVEDHQEVPGLQVARLIECFEGHASGHGAIPDHGDASVVLLLEIPGHGHAQHGGDAGAGVAGAEVVVGAFIALEEAGQPVVLAQGGEAVFAAREDLVGIGLMTHVPYDAVLQEVEVVEQRHREFDGAEVGAEVPAGLRYRGDQEGPDLSGQLLQLRGREVPYLLGRGQGIKQRIGAGGGRHAGAYLARSARYRAQAAKEFRLGRDAS